MTTQERERGRHEAPRERIFPRLRRRGQGNPAQQTAPYGVPVDDTQGYVDIGEARAEIPRARADTEAEAEQDNIGGNYPGENPAQDEDSRYMPPARETSAAPLTQWGKVSMCPDCRGEGDCSGCYRTADTTGCAYCGGTRTCPSCGGAKYVRIAPAQAPAKASAAPTLPEITARVFAEGPAEAMGARVLAMGNGVRALGRVSGLRGDQMLVRWRDGKSTLEKITEYEFRPEGA